jgi:para-aminobenzoate synthetase component 1
LRTSIHKEISNAKLFKSQLLTWAQQFREVVFLDSNDYPQKYSNYDCILAVDAFTSITTDYHNAFEDLKQYQQTSKDWIFGYLSYDLKNDTEELESSNFDGLQFPDLFFFQPKKLFLIKNNQLEIQYLNMCDDEVEEDMYLILKTTISTSKKLNPIEIHQRISKDLYQEKVERMLEYINKGDIYEANFCMEFYVETMINPLAYLKNNNNFLLSATPERYLNKENNKIISQPIKGTSKRFADFEKDEISKNNLALDPKERSENIMITDLVRNDLSRTAKKGSVEVEELCGIYSFLQVHQMISTITSIIDDQYCELDVIKNSFPMGSMTGAPKISAMKIIEELEDTKRGLYSGSVGYFTPNGDFDFNVVIRSILYNSKNNYVSFSVGSAITALSIPELEYEECLLKADAMIKVLNSN